MTTKFPLTIVVLSILILFVDKVAHSQSLPVGTPLEDAYRRQQLLGKIDSNVSFTIRPLSPAAAFGKENIFDVDGSLKVDNNRQGDSGIYKTADGKGVLQLLPVSWQQQYNTHNPYGWNDGAMIPAAGYQSLFSMGVYARYKFLSIQLQPEFVYAQNKKFDGFTQAGNEAAVWKAWYNLYNYTDLPERFGAGPYSKLFPGQSSIRINFDPVSFGLSTENLWWGPGVNNSLVMSNTATGFAHLTLNTTRPVKTAIGSFEAQLIAGKLVNSNYSPLVLGQSGNQDALYIPQKINDWRYLSGLVVTYHPKWVPGLFLGITRVFQQYHTDVAHSFSGYLPVFTAFSKASTYDPATNVQAADKIKQDELTSFFARWVWTEANGEIYFEYGKNDHNWNFRDLFLDPEHSRAYIWGIKKMFKAGSNPNARIMVSLETTELGQPANDIVERKSGYWYTHSQVTQGYTNNGEVLGAGIGPGGNMQTLDVSWVNGLRKMGFQIGRYEHNADFYYKAFASGELRRHWVDFNLGVYNDWTYKHFLFSAKLNYIDQLNYQWKFGYDPALFYWNYNKYDANNFQLALGLSYRF
jgi:hypothetical protein